MCMKISPLTAKSNSKVCFASQNLSLNEGRGQGEGERREGRGEGYVSDEKGHMIELLEIEYRGVCARIKALLHWGGMVASELDDCIAAQKDLEGQIENLTGGPSTHRTDTLDGVSKGHIEATLARYNGNKSQAARVLGIGRRSLLRKCNKYGVRSEAERCP